MEDSQDTQKDVNIQNADADSSSTSQSVDSANPPTTEKVEAQETGENRIPQSRFNQVVQERNRERERVEQLEARMRDLEYRGQNAQPKESIVEAEVKRLVSKLGMEESAAREIVESNNRVLEYREREQEQRRKQNEARYWAANKAKNDPDWSAIEPVLDRQFSQLSQRKQAEIASDPELLDMFYASVKLNHGGDKTKDAYARGVDEAYKAKAVKAAMSSVPGGSSNSGKEPINREWFKKATPEMHKARQAEINAFLEGKA